MAQASGVLSPLPQPLVLPQLRVPLNLGLPARSSLLLVASLTLMVTPNNSLGSTPLVLTLALRLAQLALANPPGIKHLVELLLMALSPGQTKVPLVCGRQQHLHELYQLWHRQLPSSHLGRPNQCTLLHSQ